MYEEAGQWPEAAMAYEGALARNASRADWHAGLARLQEKMGDVKAAAAAYRSALECDGSQAEWHASLARIYEEMRDWRAAATAYRAALEDGDGPANWHAALGRVYESMSEWHLSAAAYKAALARDGSQAEWHASLARIYEQMRDRDAAAAAYKAALARDGSQAEWHASLARIYEEMRDWRAAAAAYRAALEGGDGPTKWHAALGRVYERLSEWDAAAAAYKAALARDDSQAKWHAALARTYGMVHDWDAASAAYNAAVERDGNQPRWHAALAGAQHKLGDLPAAARAYEAALTLDRQATRAAGVSPAKNLGWVVSLIDALYMHDPTAAESLRRAIRVSLFSDCLAGVTSAEDALETRIAYIPNSPVPTSAANCVHAMKLCSAIAKRGVDLVLLATEPQEKDRLTADIFDFCGVQEFPWVTFPGCGNSKIDFLGIVTQLRKCHVTHVLTRSPVAAYFALLAGFPTCLDRHVPFADDDAALVRELFRQPALRGISVTTDALRCLVEERFPDWKDQIYLVPNAADLTASGATEFQLAKVEETECQVGYVGHLYPGKGAEIVVALAKRMPRVGFHLVGGTEQDIGLWLSASTQLRNVVFYGLRSQIQVSAFLNQVDVAIAPYLRRVSFWGGSQEDASQTSSLKIFEYMAHARPIVCSDLRSLREVLTDGETALLCDPDEIEQWVGAIDRLRASPKLRLWLGHNAQRALRENYTWSKRAERLMGILIGNPGAQTGCSAASAGIEPIV